MWRKVYLLVLLTIVIGSDTAQARRWRLFCRHRRCTNVCCNLKEKLVIYHCIRDVYADFPGTSFDLYRCVTHEGSCPDLNAYADLWYGNALYWPQYCLGPFNNCEEEEGYGHGDPPGHEDIPPPDGHAPFTSADDADNWIRPLHPGAAAYRYYRIAYSGAPGGHIYAIVFKDHGGGQNYFGIETANFGGWTDMNVTLGPIPTNPSGTVLRLEYTDPNARQGLIWMR
jgi:hypothetical protein